MAIKPEEQHRDSIVKDPGNPDHWYAPKIALEAGEWNVRNFGQWKPWSDNNVADFTAGILVEECDRLTRNWQLRWKEAVDRAEAAEARVVELEAQLRSEGRF